MSLKIVIGIVAAVAIALLVGAYVWSPFRAMDALGHAVRNRDRDSLAALVDFPSVRENLKTGFAARMEKRAGESRNPLASLAFLFAPTVIGPIVDAIVTPDGIVLLLSRPFDDREGTPGHPKKKWNYGWHFVDLSHFKAEYSEAGDPGVVFGFLFERRGLFSWQLVRLDLPEDEIARRIEGSGDTSKSGGEPERSEGEGAPAGGSQNGALPTAVGACADVTVKQVSTRLEDPDGTAVPGSGSAIEYTNGGYQVSYDTIDGIEHSKPGDKVHLCLAEIPQHCPPGDNRGRVYGATNLRTRETWTAPDAEHACGGA
jgi:hypothetical protein